MVGERGEGALVGLTAFVALLEVAVAGLHRRALAVVVDAVAGATSLLDAPPTRHRTVGPFRPGGPAVLRVVTRYRREGGMEGGREGERVGGGEREMGERETMRELFQGET